MVPNSFQTYRKFILPAFAILSLSRIADFTCDTETDKIMGMRYEIALCRYVTERYTKFLAQERTKI